MSTDPIAFNELGQILSMGGEQALARLISTGASEERIVLLFFTRFEPMRASDRAALRRLAREMVSAGEFLDALDPGDTFGPNEIPVNQFLFGDTPGGRRMRIESEVEFGIEERLLRTSVDFADVPTVPEFLEASRLKALEILGQYPERFGLSPGEPIDLVGVTIPFTERRF